MVKKAIKKRKVASQNKTNEKKKDIPPTPSNIKKEIVNNDQ